MKDESLSSNHRDKLSVMLPPSTFLHTQRFETPLGEVMACASSEGLCFLDFVNTQRLHKQLTALERVFGMGIQESENPYIQQAKQELKAYFEGTLQSFQVPLHTPGTAFQQRVWQYLQTIPYGRTTSYQQEAEGIGQPTAMRAVANANGANRISILIPCHRVIGKSGELVGYGGGLERKKWLLEHEGALPQPTRKLF